jgi:hypothetical protein
MTDETNLPPEVAEALDTVRDYLLRVTAENARLHESALDGYEDGWHALRNERDELQSVVNGQQSTMGALKRTLALAEMERDSLRARIDGAPVATDFISWTEMHSGRAVETINASFVHKRVRLVVEDEQ